MKKKMGVVCLAVIVALFSSGCTEEGENPLKDIKYENNYLYIGDEVHCVINPAVVYFDKTDMSIVIDGKMHFGAGDFGGKFMIAPETSVVVCADNEIVENAIFDYECKTPVAEFLIPCASCVRVNADLTTLTDENLACLDPFEKSEKKELDDSMSVLSRK